MDQNNSEYRHFPRSVDYKFARGRYNATYYGEKCDYLKVRVGEH